MCVCVCFPGGSAGKGSTCNAGDPGSVPGLGRSAGDGIGYLPPPIFLGFPCGSAGKESYLQCGRPGLGRSPGGGPGNPFSILAWRIPMDRGAWRAAVHGVAKSRTQLSD